MTQSGVLATAWRRKALVITITAAFGIGGLMLSLSRPDAYLAQATVVLEDPDLTGVLGIADSSDRVVANQLEVFRSGIVASKAAEIATAEGHEVTASEVLSNTTFTTLRGTDVIVVAFSDPDPARAAVMVDSVIASYDQVQRDQRRSANTSVLARLDSAEEVLQTALDEVGEDVDQLRASRGIETQIEAVLDRISGVQSQLLGEVDSETRGTLMGELADLRDQVEALQLASEIESESGALAGLLETRDSLRSELASIEERRTELEIQTATEGSGVAFVSPATATETTTGAGHLFSALGGLILGGLIAIGVAYSMASGRRRFEAPDEPETVIGAPLLAEIPRWQTSNRATLLPVRDDPRSLAAEAFRFAASSIELRLGTDSLKSVSFVSATVGEGKSTLVANTALAATRTGRRVLLVDADFGSQDSSKLLLGPDWLRPGLTDLLDGYMSVDSVLSTVTSAHAGSLDVIGRGTLDVTAPDFFANPKLREAMSKLSGRYDMVLIDGPPLLQVAYASAIARLADGLLIIVGHESPIRTCEELVGRVDLIGTPALGYLYNLAPRRLDRETNRGSMSDVLGDRLLAVPASDERTR